MEMEKSEKMEFLTEIRLVVREEVGFLREEMNGKFALVAEQFDAVHGRIDRMQATLDDHGRMIDVLVVDMVIVKADVASIKTTLETKADAEDLKTLRDILGH